MQNTITVITFLQRNNVGALRTVKSFLMSGQEGNKTLRMDHSYLKEARVEVELSLHSLIKVFHCLVKVFLMDLFMIRKWHTLCREMKKTEKCTIFNFRLISRNLLIHFLSLNGQISGHF